MAPGLDGRVGASALLRAVEELSLEHEPATILSKSSIYSKSWSFECT